MDEGLHFKIKMDEGLDNIVTAANKINQFHNYLVVQKMKIFKETWIWKPP